MNWLERDFEMEEINSALAKCDGDKALVLAILISPPFNLVDIF